MAKCLQIADTLQQFTRCWTLRERQATLVYDILSSVWRAGQGADRQEDQEYAAGACARMILISMWSSQKGTTIRMREAFKNSEGNNAGSVPWYAVAFHKGSFGTTACVGFAKLCKNPQDKLVDFMAAVLLLSQSQARQMIYWSIWILGFTIQSGTTRTQVLERDYPVVGLVSRIASEVWCCTMSLPESAQSFLAWQCNEWATCLELEVNNNKQQIVIHGVWPRGPTTTRQRWTQQDDGDNEPSPDNWWAEFMEFDKDFQEEFSNILVSNDDIKEAHEDFTPKV